MYTNQVNTGTQTQIFPKGLNNQATHHANIDI